MTPELAALAITAFAAAVVNGALGHGFSSITVPVALLFHAAAVLNPALVPVEVAMNAGMLVLARRSVGAVWRPVVPIVLGLVPGVAVGSWLLSWAQPEWLKLFVFATLLPLVLLQAAGIRRPLRSGPASGAALGAGVGTLYGATTVSGPPLALFLNNQGLVKEHFRAAIALIRLAESSMTAVAYGLVGLYTPASQPLLGVIVPVVLLGLPLGGWLVRRVPAEQFRRICMSFDVWILGFGLARSLRHLGLAEAAAAWGVMLAAIAVDAWLLATFFRQLRRAGRVA